jgi:ABC superfamily ATP binding cassette transporter, permease protein
MRPGIPVIYRKALRDLWQLRSQALAIVGVVMAGIAMLTMLQIAFHSLLASRDHLFSAAQGNLPDVWVSLKRAPEAVARQVAALPGVAQVQTRIMASGKLALAGVDEPLQTQLVSLPDDGRQPVQNRLFLQAGRRPAPWSRDEVVISEAFAAVHHLQPGARLQVTVNGRTQGFRVVGVGGSPEFLYQLAPGSVFPDHAHFAVLWVPRSTLAAATNMKGAFNALSATLSRQGAAPGHEADALAAIDHVLDRWGGLGAIGRDEQISTRRLRDELAQLQINVRLLPTVFLAVAAFLLHVVFTRLVGLQRGQIAILKAFGYRTSTVVLHYALMAATICVAGALLGVLAGSGMGHWLAVTYQHNFRFPSLHHAVDLKTVLTGVAVAVLAGMAGASQAVLRAVREPVAQAMRPQPPERYRVAGIGQGLVARYLP